MSQIKGRNTKPEITVRRIVHALGYRYRLHRRDLPGTPDLVLPRHRKIIFIHGCYWHMHSCRYGQVTPKTNARFWQTKRSGNVERDRRNLKALKLLGWKTLVVWECNTKKPALMTCLQKFLGPSTPSDRPEGRTPPRPHKAH